MITYIESYYELLYVHHMRIIVVCNLSNSFIMKCNMNHILNYVKHDYIY